MGPSYLGLDHWGVETWLRFCALIGLCGVMMLMSGGMREKADAAEWSATPSLSVKGVYNSNLLLSNGNNQVWGDWVNPDLKFRGATEAFWIEGGARAEFVQYYGDRDRAYTNLYFPLKASYVSDRNTFGFDGGFTRDNTLQGELQKTGLVLSFTQRNLWTAMPSWTFGITERLSWQSSYQFTDAQYENGLRLGLVNYQVHGGSTGPTYNLGERDQVQLTGEYTLVSTPSINQTSSYYGVQGGGTHDFGQDLKGTVSGGVRFVNSTQNIPGGSLNDHATVWVYNGTLSKRFERTTVQLEGGRNIYPSGFGSLVKTDRVSGTISHNISETISASLNGGIYFAGGILTHSSTAHLINSRFTSISPAVSWKFSQWWVLDVGYTYAERAVGSLNQWNFANSTFVMLTYGGPKWSVSR